MTPGDCNPTVAIIGGGVTGAAVAYHLARAGAEARIVVFEPRERLGAGLAYSDEDPSHRVNVPATRMALSPDDPGEFARWLKDTDALACDPLAFVDGEAYPARALFGRYAESVLRPFVEAGHIAHVREVVVSLSRSGNGWKVRTANGAETAANLAVIATTHPRPGLPRSLESLGDDPALVRDALGPAALDTVRSGDRVLIVGTGLTAADIVATLDARGHSGAITLISRRGLRSRGHPTTPFPPEGDFTTRPADTATRLVRDIRRAIRCAVTEGRSWHPVLDAVREQGQDIWKALAPDARRRIVRHLRAYWDVHRFRSAPQIEALLNRKLADGSAELVKAHIGGARRTPAGVQVVLADGTGRVFAERVVDHIIVATGPAHEDIARSQPYLAALLENDDVAIDETKLGLRTSRGGNAINGVGKPAPDLFIAGPLARGTFGELMGLPQVSAYARFLAERISEKISLPSRTGPTSRSHVSSPESVL